MGTSCRTRSLIRTLCSAPARVSRSVARTRRSSAARSGPGSSKGCSPAGSTRPRRARVSASIPLVLVCREKNRRRSAALAELTRYTRWPREPKNTAIGSHAGPVGSMITSKRVPEGVVASAAASTSPDSQWSASTCAWRWSGRPRRSLVPCAQRRSPSRSPPGVCVPSRLLVSSCRFPPARPQERRSYLATVPRRHAQPTAPTHVLQPGPASKDRPTSLIRGIRGRAGCDNQTYGTRPHGPSPQSFSTPPPGPAGMTMQPWDHGADQAPVSLT